jgi:integrase/recombinase XerD
MQLTTAVDAFLTYCVDEKHLAPNTLLAYRQDLFAFKRFAGRRRRLDTIQGDDLLGYRNSLVQCGLSAATSKRRLACLRAFFAWFVRHSILEQSPFSRLELTIRLPARLPRCLDGSELRRLMRYRTTLGETCSLAVGLLLATGMRVGELAAVCLADIDAAGDRIRIFGKGSRERTVFVTDDALRKELRAYIDVRHGRSVMQGQHLLVDMTGRPVSAARIRRLIGTLAHDAGLSRRVTPHMMRHTAATMLLESGIDIRFVQRLLGHRSIVTTQIYTHVSDRALRAALARADVLARFRSATPS